MPTTEKNNPLPERRRGPDLLRKAFAWLAVLAWLVFLLAIILVHYARPEMDTGLVRYFGLDLRDTWRPVLTQYLQGLLWLTACLSAISLTLNYLRSRRHSDHLHFNIVLLLLSSSSLLLYLYRIT